MKRPTIQLDLTGRECGPVEFVEVDTVADHCRRMFRGEFVRLPIEFLARMDHMEMQEKIRNRENIQVERESRATAHLRREFIRRHTAEMCGYVIRKPAGPGDGWQNVSRFIILCDLAPAGKSDQWARVFCTASTIVTNYNFLIEVGDLVRVRGSLALIPRFPLHLDDCNFELMNRGAIWADPDLSGFADSRESSAPEKA